MTNEQINKMIAEAVGWESKTSGPSWYEYETKRPNYAGCLNAMHEAEQMLWGMDWSLRGDFIDHLARVINPIHGYRMQDGIDLLDATARQRAEAFLKTLEKWEEGA